MRRPMTPLKNCHDIHFDSKSGEYFVIGVIEIFHFKLIRRTHKINRETN